MPRLAGPAALALTCLMVGAVFTQLVVVGSGVPMPLPFLVVSAASAWGRRRRTAQFWARIAPR